MCVLSRRTHCLGRENSSDLEALDNCNEAMRNEVRYNEELRPHYDEVGNVPQVECKR